MAVVMVHGDRGGVGKSTVAMALGEYILAKQLPLVIVECDASNPDVARYFDKLAPVRKYNLRVTDGWIEFLSMLETEKTNDVVVSLPAGIGSMFAQNAADLAMAAAEMKRTLAVLWPLNRSADSITLLKPVLSAFGNGSANGSRPQLVAIRNLYFGDPEKFARWGESETRKKFAKEGGIEMDLPDMHDQLVDATLAAVPPKRVVAMNGESGLLLGQRMYLSRWVNSTFAAFDTIADKVGVGKW
jgi:hypothetical protein